MYIRFENDACFNIELLPGELYCRKNASGNNIMPNSRVTRLEQMMSLPLSKQLGGKSIANNFLKS